MGSQVTTQTLNIDILNFPAYIAQEHSHGRQVFTAWATHNDPNETEAVAAYKYKKAHTDGRRYSQYNVVVVYRNKFGTEWSRTFEDGKIIVVVPLGRRTDQAIADLITAITRAPMSAVSLSYKDSIRESLSELQIHLDRERAAR
jgi:hypothetical protein